MHNPWASYPVTGDWENHASYSEGGTDWPLAYGTALYAPAAGRLENNGWKGTAGRRATLWLDTPVKRVRARSTTRMLGGYVEHDCDMVAVVLQHAKGYLGSGHYDEGALIGFSGASASGLDWGGDVHLHAHGLCKHGRRVDFMKFVGASTAGGSSTPIDNTTDEEEIDVTFDSVTVLKFPAETGDALYMCADNGNMVKLDVPLVANILRDIKAGVFNGKYNRAQYTEFRKVMRQLFPRPTATADVDEIALAEALAGKIPGASREDLIDAIQESIPAISEGVVDEFKDRL
ncbi:hypothetical protein [Agromyces sp. SYSU T00194]|uniref:hypothetical protein n=1 Tax=Agromyces chitinivorans TaxID=3158560 RepID=UPI003397DEF5